MNTGLSEYSLNNNYLKRKYDKAKGSNIRKEDMPGYIPDTAGPN